MQEAGGRGGMLWEVQEAGGHSHIRPYCVSNS